jgi:hypothetical protein
MQMSNSIYSFDNLLTGGATGLDFPAQSSPTVSKMASSVKKLRKKSLYYNIFLLIFQLMMNFGF